MAYLTLIMYLFITLSPIFYLCLNALITLSDTYNLKQSQCLWIVRVEFTCTLCKLFPLSPSTNIDITTHSICQICHICHPSEEDNEYKTDILSSLMFFISCARSSVILSCQKHVSQSVIQWAHQQWLPVNFEDTIWVIFFSAVRGGITCWSSNIKWRKK